MTVTPPRSHITPYPPPTNATEFRQTLENVRYLREVIEALSARGEDCAVLLTQAFLELRRAVGYVPRAPEDFPSSVHVRARDLWDDGLGQREKIELMRLVLGGWSSLPSSGRVNP